MWVVDYDNDTGSNDDTFSEWWTVSDGNRTFKSDTEADAEWLCVLLNNIASKQLGIIQKDEI